MKKLLFLMTCVILTGAFVSAQNLDLKIDFQFNVKADDTNNYLTYSGPQRFGAVNKDTYDAISGASKQKSTALFSVAYQTDITGRAAFPGTVRNLLMYPVDYPKARIEDNLTVTKAGNGAITVQYAHRGIAYRLITDAQGKLTFPKSNSVMRVIGYIAGEGPQVISKDFSSDGTAAKLDWAKVWDAKTPSGTAITGDKAPANLKTGPITNDWENSSIFHFAGPLQFAFDGTILKINGTLRATQGAPK